MSIGVARAGDVELKVSVHGHDNLAACLPRLETYVAGRGPMPLSRHPAWLVVLERGLGHVPYCLEAVEGGRTRGLLPLAFIRSVLFGRFLVSLPYLNYGGPLADDARAESALIDAAVDLTERLDARHLELRQEAPAVHPALGHRIASKVHMRLALPPSAEELWGRLSAKVRNQVRKGQKNGLTVAWGGPELVSDFYAVFSRNMRDLGTPVYGRGLFLQALSLFPGRTELCVIRAGDQAVAAALLLHGWGISEVPSAGSLRAFNHTNANMLMYWCMLERSIERGQASFDFGRCSRGSNTYRFKQQWGALPGPADWQFYVRRGEMTDMRPDHPRYRRLIRIWQRLPVRVTRLLGPLIVRGIP